MSLSEKRIREFQEIFEKNKGEKVSYEEASEMGNQLVNFYKLLYDISLREVRKQRELKDHPNGMPCGGQYSCIICRTGINPETGWYDWNGNKCLACQKAVDTGVVPAFVCKNDESYIRTWQIKNDLNLHHQTIKKYVREGKLKAREILNENGTVHEYIFLKKENPNLIIKFNPIRKSYDRHREKEHRKWVKKQKEELRKKYKKYL